MRMECRLHPSQSMMACNISNVELNHTHMNDICHLATRTFLEFFLLRTIKYEVKAKKYGGIFLSKPNPK